MGGAVLADFTAPLLKKVSCMNMVSCYPLAFGFPSILALGAIIIVAMGYNYYRLICARQSRSYLDLVSVSLQITTRLHSAALSNALHMPVTSPFYASSVGADPGTRSTTSTSSPKAGRGWTPLWNCTVSSSLKTYAHSAAC